MTNIKLPYVHSFRDSRKKLRHTFRRAGCKKITLPGLPGSREFMEAYQACLDGGPAPAVPGASRTKPGSFDALIVAYYQSSAFTTLAKITQSTYRGQIEAFRKEHGGKPVSSLETKHIDAILGKVAAGSTSQAHKLRIRLGTLMRLAKKWGYCTQNPMIEAERIRHKTKGYRTWTDADVAKFRARWPIGSAQRIAFEIIYYTGLRRSDAVRLGPQHIQDGWIVISTKKSGEMVELNIPIHAEFEQFLSHIQVSHLGFIVTGYGAVRSEKGFTNWIIDAAREAELPPRSSPHGIRKAACKTLAEAGCTALQIMSITGHQNLKELETYCAAANKRHLARQAIDKRNGAA